MRFRWGTWGARAVAAAVAVAASTAACGGGDDDALDGAAVRVLSQSQGLPVYVVGSTFGGAPGEGRECS